MKSIRLRFEKCSQVFPCGHQIILPPGELKKYLESGELKKQLQSGEAAPMPWVEIPPVIWPSHADAVRSDLKELADMGIRGAVAENIGAVGMALELGFEVHGGMLLNILNSEAAGVYASLGALDLTASFEISAEDFRKLKSPVPMGLAVYGYLPLMKFRSCPVRGEKGCGSCTGKSLMTDRKNEEFTILCRGRQYSELFNCVPLYIGDKPEIPSDFDLFYFTTESRDRAEAMLKAHMEHSPADFRRTTGLYFRELL